MAAPVDTLYTLYGNAEALWNLISTIAYVWYQMWIVFNEPFRFNSCAVGCVHVHIPRRRSKWFLSVFHWFPQMKSGRYYQSEGSWSTHTIRIRYCECETVSKLSRMNENARQDSTSKMHNTESDVRARQIFKFIGGNLAESINVSVSRQNHNSERRTWFWWIFINILIVITTFSYSIQFLLSRGASSTRASSFFFLLFLVPYVIYNE